jgi:hypothetical protein
VVARQLLGRQNMILMQVLQRPVKHLQLLPVPIKRIGKLIAVAGQMLYRNFLVRTYNAALKQRKCILN